MVRINKVYTRKGDGGNTSLVGGRAAAKDDPRVACFGTVDELNSALGIARAHNRAVPASPRGDALERILQAVQQRLFDLGAELATHPDDARPDQPRLATADVAWLERVIDAMNAELPPLESFLLPGGGLLGAHLHLARTVCRRAEREAVALARGEAVGAQVVPYLNRLSDLLFVAARWAAVARDEPEVLWQPRLALDDSWRW